MVMVPEAERILVVDDCRDTREVLERTLSAEGYRVFTARSVGAALRTLQATRMDLVITDFKMPKVSGMDLLHHVRDNLRDTEVIMITGYPSIEGAVEAMKTGAEEYLAKPFTNEELLLSVQRVLEKSRLRRQSRLAADTALSRPPGLIGDSDAIRKVLRAIEKAASTSATVLITGESGTGKELVARGIHYGSARSAAPFVPVNCGGIPEGLLESEMFGHVKGAFTGATGSRAGFFHSADSGTIFLDEVGEMSLAMQVKILRALQDKEIAMVGSERTRKVDVRILAATNKNLEALVRKGLFREDLYYRLNVISLTAPPLRERENDILILARHFAAKFAAETGKQTPRFTDEALHALRHYDWPGNVRELENVIQRVTVMAEDDLIQVSDFPSLMRFSAAGKIGFSRTLAEVEGEYIQNVLASVSGNKTRAAEILGIDRKTLRQKLQNTVTPVPRDTPNG